MTKQRKAEILVIIRKAARVTVLRDAAHVRGDSVALDIGEVTDSEIGGDIANVRPTKRRKRKGKRVGKSRVLRAIAHTIVAASGIGGMVAASGIAHALGWA